MEMFLICAMLAVLLCGCARPGWRPQAPVDAYTQEPLLLSVPYISQNPMFPTGCEAVSAVMLLQFYGYNITPGEFIDGYLPCAPLYTNPFGELCGPNPNHYYVGDPRSENGFGCYAPVIEKAISAYLGSSTRVQNTTGLPLDALCRQYLARGVPVLVWAGINMQPVRPGTGWQLPGGQNFTWLAGEHCLVLIGQDDQNYIFNDPISGQAVAYEKSAVQACYKALGMQSLVLKSVSS